MLMITPEATPPTPITPIVMNDVLAAVHEAIASQLPSPTPITPIVMNDVLAAEYLGISAHTLRKWRSQGTGPAYVCVGRLKKYRLPDLVAFAQNQLVRR